MMWHLIAQMRGYRDNEVESTMQQDDGYDEPDMCTCGCGTAPCSEVDRG